jgi:hypothetical protein
MPGVPRELAEHELNIYPGAKPARQSLRRFVEPKHKAIAIELHRLQDAKFNGEIQQSTWLASPVLVPKKNTNEQTHMC